MITIRKSTSNDAPALADIWRDSTHATHDFLSPSDLQEIETLVREKYLPNTEVWVVEKDENPAGFMGMTDNHIDSLFIAPSMRGKGVGKHMIAYAKALLTIRLQLTRMSKTAKASAFTYIWVLCKQAAQMLTIKANLIDFKIENQRSIR